MFVPIRYRRIVRCRPLRNSRFLHPCRRRGLTVATDLSSELSS